MASKVSGNKVATGTYADALFPPAGNKPRAAALAPTPGVALLGLDDYEEGVDELSELQDLIQKVVRAKTEKALKAQAEVLAALQSELTASIAELENEVVKGRRENSAYAKKQFAALSAQLDGKYKQIEETSAKFSDTISKLWEEYSALHSKMDQVAAQVNAADDKRRAGLKRKLASLQEESEARLKKAEAEVSKKKQSASKMPQLAKILQSLE